MILEFPKVTHPVEHNFSCFRFFKYLGLFVIKADNITKIGNDWTIMFMLLSFLVKFT